MFDLSGRSAILLLHITAGFLMVGSSMFSPLTRRAILSARTVDALRAWLDFAHRASRANPVVALTLLGTGIYLGAAGWWNQAWFYVALAAWVVNSVLSVAVIERSTNVLARAAGRSGAGPLEPELEEMRANPVWDVAEEIVRANDLAMIVVMVVKPSLVESCLIVAALLVGSGLLLLWRMRRPAPALAEAAELPR